jgi:uncharacterized membrane protein YfcA
MPHDFQVEFYQPRCTIQHNSNSCWQGLISHVRQSDDRVKGRAAGHSEVAPMIDGTTAQVVAVIFITSLIRSSIGFGEALIAVPVLAFLIPVKVAAPLIVLISITVAGVIVLQDWHKIHIRSAGRLILSTLFGIPLGLLLLTSVAESTVKMVLAVVIVSFSVYCLISRRGIELKDDRLAWVFGFSAGVLGGAYGMNGPPLVLYGAFRRWSAEQFRATLQGYFLPASMAGMCGYWLSGLWVSEVTRYYWFCLPLVLLAVVLGRAVNQRLTGHAVYRYIHVVLILVGTGLFLQAMWK